jgi:hypothetical protein
MREIDEMIEAGSTHPDRRIEERLPDRRRPAESPGSTGHKGSIVEREGWRSDAFPA